MYTYVFKLCSDRALPLAERVGQLVNTCTCILELFSDIAIQSAIHHGLSMC